MKSTVCHLDGSRRELGQALKETEKTAAYAGLGKRETLQLRLLAEELTGIFKGVAGDFAADFWVEEEKGIFRLNLASVVRLGREKKEKLISLSSSGKNEADKGFMGKLGRLFEAYADNCDEVGEYCAQAGIMLPGMQLGSGDIMTMNSYTIWSLSDYKDSVVSEKKEEEWDELECSIVAKLADDVTVSVRNQKVHLTVTKKFG